jgi:effector-binding domain-containing protein
MTYDIRIEHHDSQRLAVVRSRASLQQLPKVIPATCGLVWGVVRSQPDSRPGRHVAVFWDDRINLEVGVEVAGPFTAAGDVVPSATPAGKVATTTHFGPYQRLADAHQAIRSWCQQNGHAVAGPNWEIYGHWKDEWNNDPSQIRTDVAYLLAPESPASGAD